MKPPYFITGLPRSRLSWLANLLTWDRSFCHHSALAGCASLDDLCSIMTEPVGRAEIIGDADPLIGCVPLEDLVKAFPESKFVMVWRPYEECFSEELKALNESNFEGVSQSDLEGYFNRSFAGIQKLWSLVPTSRKMLVDFDRLDRVDAVEALWNFLLSDYVFPRSRYEMLDSLRVTSICRKVRARYPHQPFKSMIEKGSVLCGAR